MRSFATILTTLSVPLLTFAAHHGYHARRHGGVAPRARGDLLKRVFGDSHWTFYDITVGQVACAGKYYSANDHVVALNGAQFGNVPGSSPYCGKSITMEYNGKTISAVIVDKCPGCPEYGLDLTQGLFAEFASTDLGVLSGTWYFSDGSGGGGSAPKEQPTTTSTPEYTPPKTTSTHNDPATTPKAAAQTEPPTTTTHSDPPATYDPPSSTTHSESPTTYDPPSSSSTTYSDSPTSSKHHHSTNSFTPYAASVSSPPPSSSGTGTPTEREAFSSISTSSSTSSSASTTSTPYTSYSSSPATTPASSAQPTPSGLADPVGTIDDNGKTDAIQTMYQALIGLGYIIESAQS